MESIENLFRNATSRLVRQSFSSLGMPLAAPGIPSRINLATHDGVLSIPPSCEPKHMMAVGAIGSGKTTLIRQIISEIRRRGDKAVILDLKGEFTSYFYRPGIDMILNPLDQRTIKWTISNDVNFGLLSADAEVISNSLINDLSAQSENEKFFLQSAKNVLRGLIYYAYASGIKDNAALADVIFSDYEKIKEMLAAVSATDALSALGEKRSAQADGVLATAHVWSRAINLLSGMDGEFSMEKWLGEPGGGIIFLNASQKYQNIVSPLARFFIDFLLNTLMGMGQDLKRRVFVVLDEFQNIAAIPSLITLLALGRSAGASVIAGTTDFGLIDQKYGPNAKTTLVNSMNTLFLFKIIEPNTAEYISRALGESEVEDYSTSSSLSADESWDRVNIQSNRRMERLVLPAQLSELRVHKDKYLEVYVKILNYLSKIRLTLLKNEPCQPAFLTITQPLKLRTDDVDVLSQLEGVTKEENHA